jgi:hypothetical protein
MKIGFILYLFFSTILLSACSHEEDQAPASLVTPTSPTLWDKIKTNASPQLLLTSEFNASARLSGVGTLAWEDGVYVSDDGLHLFAFYAPMDLLKFVIYSDSYGACPPISNYVRGSILSGMDLDLETPIDNLGGCTQGVMHSDIAYASRSSTNESFSSWSRHSVSNPTSANPALFYYEGGLSTSQRSSGNYDIVFSRSTFDNNKNNLYWVQDVASLSPSNPNIVGIAGLNTANQEDNPHLERVDSSDDNKLVMLYDNHGDSSATDYLMYYSKSADGGANWDAAISLGANINSSSAVKDENIQGHLFKDTSSVWWLYFSSNRDGSVEIWRSQHNDSANIFVDFNNWAAPQKVMSVGSVNDSVGTIEGVAEPTLTNDGDLHFVVVYCKNVSDQTDYDSCDIDPWVATKK